MKLKLFCGLSTLFIALALLMPVGVYAADHSVNVTPVVETVEVEVMPKSCVALSSSVTVDGSVSADTKLNVSSGESLCGGSGGFIQFNVSWNS